MAYSSGASLGLLAELGQHAAGQLLADARHHRVRLQHLAADVERQVLAVDDAADEPQIGRQQLGALVGDEDAADIELEPRLALRVEQVERLLRRHEQQERVFEHALGAGMERQPRLVEAVPDVVIEFLVLLRRDLGARPGPQGRGAC